MEFVLDTKKLDEIAKNLDKNTDQVIRAMGMEIVQNTKAAIEAQDAVDTGAYMNSVYMATHENNDMPSSPSSLNPDAERTELPRPDKGVIHVGPSVNYAPYIEYGTYKMAARPSLLPSCEYVFREYMGADKWKVLFD